MGFFSHCFYLLLLCDTIVFCKGAGSFVSVRHSDSEVVHTQLSRKRDHNPATSYLSLRSLTVGRARKIFLSPPPTTTFF
jgi:hypothetical protein